MLFISVIHSVIDSIIHICFPFMIVNHTGSTWVGEVACPESASADALTAGYTG